MVRWKIFLLAIFGYMILGCRGDEEENGKDVPQITTKLYGTDLVLFDNLILNGRSYRFEDFFWTGSAEESGDDDYDDNRIDSEETSSTLKPGVGNSTCSSFGCDKTTNFDNLPTESGNEEDFEDAGRQFWLVTILKGDGKDPMIEDLKKSLSKLYKIAFKRQQERHLGINGRNRLKRETEKDVKIRIYNVSSSLVDGEKNIEVLYHVSVDGKPVVATTAANDMNFVTDEEVRDELGFPFLIKAEPYLKPTIPLSLSKANNTWIFIGVSIIVLLMLLLFITFMALAITKRKKSLAALEARRQERAFGATNKSFSPDSTKGHQESPTYIDFRKQSHKSQDHRSQSSLSSVSTSSGSLDISPLMALNQKKFAPKKPPRPRPKAAINKTVPVTLKQIPPELYDSDSSKDTPDGFENMDPGVQSPKSYLSMPSVKAFPRGSMPEPLNKVLEPLSVLHLDEEDDYKANRGFIRHGSVGASEDPGVVGPVVWSMYSKKLHHGVSVDEGIDDLNLKNVSKMRKRFHDLLDDTFSLFGSRRQSPVEEYPSAVPIENKSHSAVNTRLVDEYKASPPKPRPRTTDVRKLAQGPGAPKGAWSSQAPSPLVRPLSAGILSHPQVNVRQVLSEGQFKQSDPAIPLIAAIKDEIEKCSLPGSTSDVRH